MTGTIVVGVDGSPASVAALRWAVARATAERRAVTAVEVRSPTQLTPSASYTPTPYGTPPRHHDTVHDTVDAVRKAVPGAAKITVLERRGEPGIELARAAHGAEMLVLGHQRHGRAAEFLFGHVTHDCLRHVDVPVVLVPVQRTT